MSTLPALLRASEGEAVVAGGERLTYAELHDRAAVVAGALTRAGVGPGDRVVLLVDNRFEWLETAFGTLATGAVLAPINTWVRRWDLDYLLGHAAPTVLVTLGRFGKQDFLADLRELVPELWEGPGWRSARFPDLSTVVVIGDDVPPGALSWKDFTSGPPSYDDRSRPGDTALVLYTSGSTARPKAVPLVHGHLVDNGRAIGDRQGLGPDDRVFLASPLFWAFGSANALMATTTHGATLVLQRQFEAAAALDLLAAERCTAIYTMPSMTHALLGADAFDRTQLPALRKGLTIGPPGELTLAMRSLGLDLLCNIYGSTETYGNCCVTPWDAPAERRTVSQGPALDGQELRIVDPSGRVLGVGEVGEILVRGRITPGYLDADGIPQTVVDADGFFPTGDLGSLDADGWVTFAAREAEMIKSSGINVSPSEVEDFLSGHDDVVQVVVAGGDDPVRGQQVVAFVKLRAGSAVTGDELRTWCQSSIAGYKVPRIVSLVDDFPTTDTGKISRKQLAAVATELVSGAGR